MYTTCSLCVVLCEVPSEALGLLFIRSNQETMKGFMLEHLH